MSTLSPPQTRVIEQALTDARTFCAGHIIDDRPALVHAVRVAVKLDQHAPGRPHLICAALLHDSPLFAPAMLDLDAHLTSHYGPEVTRIIRAMQAQHEALDSNNPPLLVDDYPVLLATTADKIVALTSLLRRARLSGDTTGFFRTRGALLRLLPHFHAYHRAGATRVPVSMTTELGDVLVRMDRATAAVRDPRPASE